MTLFDMFLNVTHLYADEVAFVYNIKDTEHHFLDKEFKVGEERF